MLLWFGSWKNGMSSYAPSWVKKDAARFPRALITVDGALQLVEHLSPFGPDSRAADAAAFTQLMTHLRDADALHGTVIMVQVENEVGLLGDSRDRSPAAEAAFHSPVTADVLQTVRADPMLRVHREWESRASRTDGTWTEVFGESATTDEAFMATAYADYIGEVSARGRAIYDIPLFVNAWLDSDIDIPGFPLAGGMQPGFYPSGGPLPHVAGLWRAKAPALDLLVPDIYFGDPAAICGSFASASGGLFIPEMRSDAAGASLAFEAIGEHGALGVAPFGMDSLRDDEGAEITDAYRIIDATHARIHDGRSRSATRGFRLTTAEPTREITFDEITLTATLFTDFTGNRGDRPGYGIIIRQLDGSFIVAGRGFKVTAAGAGFVGIDTATELSATDLAVTRILNGDETQSGSGIVHQPLGHTNNGNFPIPASVGGTGITHVTFYSLDAGSSSRQQQEPATDA
ncbi:hypothetical protein GCM10009776_28060 [Microbacterium deminutum]|uniref:DUF5597 domain-containing protein n=1 Tax=Microbacterium deminutum TaxID=344164 RepID=A0ABP5CLY4_9MICO